MLVRLEVNLTGELDNPRIVGLRKLAEATVANRIIKVLEPELGVVEGIEGLQAKPQTTSFAEGEVLEQREVPVVPARSA